MKNPQQKIFLIAGCLFLCASLNTKAQQTKKFDIRRQSFMLPSQQPNGRFKHMVSLTSFFLPSDWTNVSLNAPMIGYNARYHLPANFSVEVGGQSLYVANKVVMGVNWFHSFSDHFHVGVGYQVAYNFGKLKDDYQFATTVTAFSYRPSITIGYSNKESAISLQGGFEHLNDVNIQTGSNVVKDDYAAINGAFLRATLEQRIWKNHVFAFAVELDVMQFVIVAWPAYPVNNKRYSIPQVTLGYTL